MISHDTIRFATLHDARTIAHMSRDFVETGLGWTWNEARVISEIKNQDSNVIVTADGSRVVGFAVMKYYADHARLNLFAVHPRYRRKGIGSRMIKWLEACALANGNGIVFLETRITNRAARAFYQTLGYTRIERLSGYYSGREAAIRMGHDLWFPNPTRK